MTDATPKSNRALTVFLPIVVVTLGGAASVGLGRGIQRAREERLIADVTPHPSLTREDRLRIATGIQETMGALIARPDVKALDGDARVKRLYALAFQRAPTRRELAAAREFLRQASPLPKTAVTSTGEAATVPGTEVAKPPARTDGDGGKRGGRASSKAPAKPPEPLGPWEQYAQVLLAANEFSFID